jgi:CheY-like chemotaxis protein
VVPESKPTAAPAPGPSGATPVVLVIDDDPTVHDLMGRMLEKDGFHVLTAANGPEGVRLAKSARPVVITLDVLMPGMDGWAVLKALKSDPDTAPIPVIMLSIIEQKNLGYALGAVDYLPKPIDRQVLLTSVRRHAVEGFEHGILVVDDDPAVRDLLARLLKQEGWESRSAENGRAALARINERPPSLILLDLMMPEIDGFQFLEEFRKNQAWLNIPVIVVTAKELTDNDRVRLNGYVERILSKGTALRPDLLKAIRQVIVDCARGKGVKSHGSRP